MVFYALSLDGSLGSCLIVTVNMVMLRCFPYLDAHSSYSCLCTLLFLTFGALLVKLIILLNISKLLFWEFETCLQPMSQCST